MAFRNSSVQRPKATKPYSGLLNLPIHQSEWPTKARAVWEYEILYTYQACTTQFGPIKPTYPSVQMVYKGQSSFGKPVSTRWSIHAQKWCLIARFYPGFWNGVSKMPCFMKIGYLIPILSIVKSLIWRCPKLK